VELDFPAQAGGRWGQRIGSAPGADEGGVALFDQAEHEGAVGLVQRQPVLQQNQTAAGRRALDARAAHVQACMIDAAKKFLQHDAGLDVERIVQNPLTGGIAQVNQIGAAGNARKAFAFQRKCWRERSGIPSAQHHDAVEFPRLRGGIGQCQGRCEQGGNGQRQRQGRAGDVLVHWLGRW